MNHIQTTIHDLLVEYQRLNQKVLLKVQQNIGLSDEEMESQVVEPPSDMVGTEIPTFDRIRRQRLTEMLQARFAYAGSWKMAEAGIDWLSLKQMDSDIRDSENVQRIIDATTLWEDSSLFGMPLSQISLFGHHPEQGVAVYLLWPVTGAGEPEILSQSGNFENRYPNLEQYLRSLIKEAKDGLQKHSESP